MKNKTILIFAPHADDEIIGCAGVIAKYKNDNKVIIVYVTKPNRMEQCDGMVKMHNDSDIITKLYEYEDQKLDLLSKAEIIDNMRETICKLVQVDYLFIPYRHDANTDHQIVAMCAIVASRAYDSNVKNVLMYEIPETTNMADPKFSPNYFVEVDCEQRLEMAKRYNGIWKDCTGKHPRTYEAFFTKSVDNAILGGIKTHAEAFQIVRMVEES